MAVPRRADRVLAKGRFGTVEYAVRLNGTMEAREWFERQPLKIQMPLAVLFEMVATRTPDIPNKEQFKRLSGNVWEFKRNQNRIFCYLHKNRYLLTHQILKKTQKTPREEINLAEKIGKEHLEWEKNERE